MNALPDARDEFSSSFGGNTAKLTRSPSKAARLPQTVSNLKSIGEEDGWGASEKAAASAHEAKIMKAALGGATDKELEDMRPELGIFDSKSPTVLLNHDAEISAHEEALRRLNYKEGDDEPEFTPTPIEEPEPAPAPAAAVEEAAPADFFLDADYGGAVAEKKADVGDEDRDSEANVRALIAAGEREYDDEPPVAAVIEQPAAPAAAAAEPAPVVEPPAEEAARAAPVEPAAPAAPAPVVEPVVPEEPAAPVIENEEGGGGASVDSVIEGGIEGAATEALIDPEIDAIPVLGDIAMFGAGIAGALYTSFANKPEAPPEEHIANVLSSASQLGS